MKTSVIEGTWDELAAHAEELRRYPKLTLIVPDSNGSLKAPKGTPGRDLLDLAGSLTPEEAEQMTRTIEEEFERIDPNAW